MIGIINYGLGNVGALKNIFFEANIEIKIISNPGEIDNNIDKLILPGVGNYAMAIAKIRKLNLDAQIEELVINQKKPILGICLGMQLLGDSSTESGFNSGLSLVSGTVDKFIESEQKVPHVGYNQVISSKDSRLYAGIEDNSDFYFTHSFKMLSGSTIGQSFCRYGEDFVASFELDNIAGVQFHPELSQKNGLQLISNFVELF